MEVDFVILVECYTNVNYRGKRQRGMDNSISGRAEEAAESRLKLIYMLTGNKEKQGTANSLEECVR